MKNLSEFTQPVIFTRTHCPKCHFLTMHLRAHHVAFSEINLDQHPEYEAVLKDAGMTALPVTYVNDEFKSGVFTVDSDVGQQVVHAAAI